MADRSSSKWLHAPGSKNTVRVRMLDTTAVMRLHSLYFIEPVQPGHEFIDMTDVAFLIENERLGKKAMFDLGVRKDFWNLPPKIQERLDSIGTGLRVEKDVSDILRENGLKLESIDDIIWSHSHWDHTGDPSLFPPTTRLVYGPEISRSKPGFPDNPDSPLPQANFAHRENFEISFSTDLRIGGFPAYDFYGDGSFYLLETPGHSKGHICGLARTTTGSDGMSTWLLLGGDVCHFCGDFRPNATNALPSKIVLPDDSTVDGDELLTRHPQFVGQGAITDDEVHRRRLHPWFRVSTHPKSSYDFPGPEVAQKTVDNLRNEFDEAENVLICLAHDTGALKVLPIFNNDPQRDLNTWYTDGLKQKLYWDWVAELGGGEPRVTGFWKDGQSFEKAKDLIAMVNGKT